MKDILTVISERDRKHSKAAHKTKKMYAIHYGNGGRASSKLFSFAKARKLVSRAKRLGLDVYIAGAVIVTM